ncbi:N-acetyltransferase [Leptospira yanagawae]|uniref:N-acetyltransferase n=1 Tax=Leptospira yanagawae TaxID=293069 RepID=A0ABY2M2H8_9LEPT|nr:GNAT family N-acetyltransferase [Leptospira yanagawae]TGL21936.1 N-acetyltransferase [Leptospira yanagawae]
MNFKIISYSEEYKDYLRILNYEWLQKYFRIEEGDVYSLSNPKEAIIDKGGYIFFAKRDMEIIGTACLMKKSEQLFELGKMAVTEKMQGYGIGTLLLKHCLEFSKSMKIKTLVLYSNTELKSAIHLYEKYGFKQTELESGLYERANIKMFKDLF